jgi:hypothetical protein
MRDVVTLVSYPGYPTGKVWRPKTEEDGFILTHLIGRSQMTDVDRNLLLLEMAAHMHDIEVKYIETR